MAAFRPFIGGVFGLLVYFALQGGLIRQLDVPEDPRDRFAFFLVLAFAAGFSERLVKEVLRSTDGGRRGRYEAGADDRRRSTRASPTRRVTPSASRRSSRSWASRRPQPARSRKRASVIWPARGALLEHERARALVGRRRHRLAVAEADEPARPLEEAGELRVVDLRRARLRRRDGLERRSASAARDPSAPAAPGR